MSSSRLGDGSQMVSVKEIAEYLGRSEHTIRYWARKKTGPIPIPRPLPRVGTRGQFWWRRADIQRWESGQA